MERHGRGTALLVAGTFFMENLDGTILTTAVPSIARSFGDSAAAIGTAITAYLVTLAVLIPLSGWLTERFGARRVLLTAIVVFTLASALCAAAPGLPALIGARVLQGVGGALMVPVGRLVVLRETAKADLVRVVALLTWPALAAPVIAPLLGGLLASTLGWRWIFLVNLPLGVVAVLAARRLVRGGPAESVPRLDVSGLLLVCVSVAAVTALGSVLSAPDVLWPLAAVLGVVGFGTGAIAVRHLTSSSRPLLALSALRIGSFRIAHAGGSAFRLAVNAVPFLLPLLFQVGFGWSPVEAGALVLLLFAGNLGIKPVTTPLLTRFGFRPVLVLATVCSVAAAVMNAFLTASTPLVLIGLVLLFGGAARSVGFTAYNTVAFADVPSAGMTDANTLASTVQQIAAGLGVAVGAVALRAGTAVAGPGGGLLPYRIAFLVIAAILAIAAVESLVAPGALGERIRPRRAVQAPGRG
ncbi:MFS transporter [Amnibacterium sp.]|uniref:MFS transporter n=1 Tax=Amnibacterium sp. TaxID=1872496 RepID=UPI00260EAFBC|nr:MFS transporter [Amnibacterium sp.]MCU1474027.1 family efflux transporter permease subunit [Amnibacterium sp.]